MRLWHIHMYFSPYSEQTHFAVSCQSSLQFCPPGAELGIRKQKWAAFCDAFNPKWGWWWACLHPLTHFSPSPLGLFLTFVFSPSWISIKKICWGWLNMGQCSSLLLNDLALKVKFYPQITPWQQLFLLFCCVAFGLSISHHPDWSVAQGVVGLLQPLFRLWGP